VNIELRLAQTNSLLSADYELAAKSYGQANGSVMPLMTYASLVHSTGPQDDKNQPGPGTQQQRVDAGNISFGVTCPFGEKFCQFAAGLAQFKDALLGNASFGSIRTFMDSPGDNASIKVGQAMRRAGCR
jgi:hypothetical protein